MRVYKNISLSETQITELVRVLDAFETHEIHHMPVKGAILKGLYPQAEMRRMGDADILINYEQYEDIRRVMADLGYEELYESDHELVWNHDLMRIELHKRLIPSYNKDYYQYYGDGWQLAKKMEGFSFRYGMDAEDEMIYLLTHFAKHYREAGIGIRHMVDLWVYRIHHPEIDEEYIRFELDKLQLLEFYENIVNTLCSWFEDSSGDEKTEFITQVIFTSGEYVRMYTANISNALKGTKGGHSVQAVKQKRLFTALYPGDTVMKKEYPILLKYPFLLPFMLVARFFRKVLFEGKVRLYLTHRLKFSADEVSGYQQSLNYVGLDFHFSE